MLEQLNVFFKCNMLGSTNQSVSRLWWKCSTCSQVAGLFQWFVFKNQCHQSREVDRLITLSHLFFSLEHSKIVTIKKKLFSFATPSFLINTLIIINTIKYLLFSYCHVVSTCLPPLSVPLLVVSVGVVLSRGLLKPDVCQHVPHCHH